MNEPIKLCGRVFTPPLIQHLNEMLVEQPDITHTSLAREVCEHLHWCSPNGRLCLSSAKVALHKLQDQKLIRLPTAKSKPGHSHRLRRSGRPLPPVKHIPSRVDKVQGLHLYLLAGAEDTHSGLWNDLIIQQHPCGDAPLVGAQLRYLVGSDHGWLGALGFGPAAFHLRARDQWIGWSKDARLRHLQEVIGLSRFLVRQEVQCTNLASKVLSLVLARLGDDWESRYGIRPLLVETFVDRSRFNGLTFAAANWIRLGTSTGRGRLGPDTPVTTPKDIWVYTLHCNARQRLQEELPEPVTPCSLMDSLESNNWWIHELEKLDLGDARRNRRAQLILAARWQDPTKSFGGSFPKWSQAKAAYGLMEDKTSNISMEALLDPHREVTLSRMATEPLVLLPQDTTSLNYTGLKQTTGLGRITNEGSLGLFLHSLLAYRPDGIPLGVLNAQAWGRDEEESDKERTRNAKSIDEKESRRWIEALQTAAAAARRLPLTQLVVMTDREGDLYELHDAVQIGPSNLHSVIRAQHDRKLKGHQKLWAFMKNQPVGLNRQLQVPRGHGQSARMTTVSVRWAQVTIQSPAVGHKKGWPPLTLWAVWVYEETPRQGAKRLEWMLLTDLSIQNADEAWEKVEWYKIRWGIEEWHRVLKSGCAIEQREFKTDEQLKRVLTFDLIMAWRILALIKLGRVVPNVPANLLYTEDELKVLVAAVKKKPPGKGGKITLQQANRMAAQLGGWLARKSDGEPGAEVLQSGLRTLHDMVRGWLLFAENAKGDT